MHACVVNGCNYPTAVPVRSIRGTGTPVCVRLTRSARPGHVAAGPTTRAHARKQTLPACLPASPQARTARRSLASCYGQRNRLFPYSLAFARVARTKPLNLRLGSSTHVEVVRHAVKAKAAIALLFSDRGECQQSQMLTRPPRMLADGGECGMRKSACYLYLTSGVAL